MARNARSLCSRIAKSRRNDMPARRTALSILLLLVSVPFGCQAECELQAPSSQPLGEAQRNMAPATTGALTSAALSTRLFDFGGNLVHQAVTHTVVAVTNTGT